MLKNDTLKNGTSHIGLYGSASPETCKQKMVPDLPQKLSLHSAPLHKSQHHFHILVFGFYKKKEGIIAFCISVNKSWTV